MAAGGARAPLRFAFARSSLGTVLLGAGADGVCALALGDDEAQLLAALQRDFPAARLEHAQRSLDATLAALLARIEAPARAWPALALELRGSPFQLRVWRALQHIPPGSTVRYGELARRLGMPQGARAVGSACAANRIALLVPCHRAVRADGGLARYRWGCERKRELLRREREGAA